MGARSFYSSWAKRTFFQSLGWGDGIASVAGSIATVITHYLDQKTATSVTVWAWEIPVWGMAAAMALRIVVAPFEMWREQKTKGADTETKLQSALALKPQIELTIDSVIWGGHVSGYDRRSTTTMILNVTLRNTGAKPSAVLNWGVKVVGEHIGEHVASIIISPVPIDLIHNSHKIIFSPGNSMIVKGDKAIGLGEITRGYLMAQVALPSDLVESAPMTVTITYEDVLGVAGSEKKDLIWIKGEALQYLPDVQVKPHGAPNG